MLRQLSNLRDDASCEQLRYVEVVKNTFIEVRCVDEHDTGALVRQHSDPTLHSSPTASYAATQTPIAETNEESCSSCPEDAMEVSTCAGSEMGDSLSQKRSASSKGSWASRISQSSKSSIGSRASKIFKFPKSTLKSNVVLTNIEVGEHCETVSQVIVRVQESLESEIITELPIGTLIEIVELGETSRRAKISAGKDVLGWISVQTLAKQALIINRETGLANFIEDFEVGGQHEVISTVTLRAGESLDSEVITDLKPGTIVKIKELGQINNRRGKVEIMFHYQARTEGWISFATRQGEFFIGKVSDKGDKNVGSPGSLLFGTSSSKLKTLLEAARDGDVEAVKNVIEGTTGFMGKLSAKPNLNASDIRGKTALIYSSAFGNKKIVDYLLSKKHEVDVNIVDDTQKSALHHATKRAKR